MPIEYATPSLLAQHQNATVQPMLRPGSFRVLDLPRLREQRLNHGMSQEELADKSGVSRTTIIKLEAGRDAWPDTARKLAKALSVKITDLRRPV